ncbi:MAG: hypothetical protein ACE5FA_14760 [Dehalococcoidia bacterium]
MVERLKNIKVTKEGVAAAGSTIGIGGSIAFILIRGPYYVWGWEMPGELVPHVSAIVIAVWNRTVGRWLLG